MDATIRRLHCRYRAVGPGSVPAALSSRLDDLVRRAVEGRCQEVLDTALSGDPAVYVLRGVRCDLSAWAGGVSGDKKAAAWGYQIASAVVHEITADAEEGGLVRFEDQSDFAAQFLADFLDGRAWERWFYFPFAPLRSLDPAGVIGAVIEDNRTDLPAILARLHRLGAVEKLLRQGGPGLAAALFGRSASQPPEAILPLAHAALLVAERLRLWKNSSAPRTAEALAALLPAPTVDWRDPRSLSAALLAALRLLYHRGDLRGAALTSQEIDAALGDLDWLDRGWLRDSLGEMLAAPPAARPAAEATPRQRRLLEDLPAVLREQNLRLLAGQTAEEAAVRLAAALYAAFPAWQGDGLADAMVARLARVAAGLSALPDPLAALRSGTVEFSHLPEGERAVLLADLSHLRGLGEAAARLVEHLLPEPGPDVEPGVECPRAGVALLFRALLDARFPALASRLSRDFPMLAGDTARAGLLLGLFQRLAALPPGEDLLPGWAELAGVPTEQAVKSLRAVRGWLDTPDGMLALQGWLAETLIGLRVLEPSTLRVSLVGEEGGRMFLAAGDGTLAVLGAPCDSAALWSSAAGWVEQFAALWSTAAGHLVAPSTSDARLLEHVPGLLPAGPPGPPVEAELSALGFRPETGSAADLSFSLLAGGLLRLWARWLPNFSNSSAGYLLGQFIERPGLLSRAGDGWLLALEARPLDLLLEMAGYLSPLEGVPWLDHRTITFQARERV